MQMLSAASMHPNGVKMYVQVMQLRYQVGGGLLALLL